jgi:hypothetical protein
MDLTDCPRCGDATFDLSRTSSGLCAGCHGLVLRKKVDDLLEWRMLSTSQHATWAGLIGDTEKVLAHSADRRPVKPGAEFWDYDLRPCTVLSVSHIEQDHREVSGATVWWKTTTGLFDGSRLAYLHPSTRMTVAEARVRTA